MHQIAIPSGMDTGFFVMEEGALAESAELLKTAFPGKTAWLIADGNTWKAAGQTVYNVLNCAGIPLKEPKIFPAEPRLHPDYAISLKIAEELNETIVPVAVGSGVLNDLTKCAAGAANVKYCCIATAASVDGYTSAGGAMSVNGTKKTVKCPAPYAILADISVLKDAPPQMLASGYADLLTKIPAGADWFIAETLGLEPRRMDVWYLVQKDLRKWVADPKNLFHIFQGLCATGYSMQLYKDSRPASGAEHMCSHVWEMEGLQYKGEEVSHGFKVGIGTVAIVQLMNFVVNTSVAEAKRLARPLSSKAEREQQIDQLLKKGCYGTGIREVALEKFMEGQAAKDRQALIFEKWETLQEKIRTQLLPLEEIIRLLKQAGAPTEYTEIGLDREQYLHGIRTAQLIRKRYSILDLLYETGLLDEAINHLC